ncbi:MAG: aldo/keto reductase [Gallicola sp.]|nr:aldo/keto reductase [Gallicola sp.]
MNKIKLNNGLSLPQLGFGTYKITDEEILDKLLPKAVDLGYGLLDTASYYNNERAIGDCICRHTLFGKLKVCTKIWPKDYGRDQTLYSIEKSMKNLRLDKLEGLFLHWPSEDFEESWKALEEVYEEGLCNFIAVSNFHKQHLEKLFVHANIKPAIDQLETHPLLQQKDMKEYLSQHNIQLEAWSPLARSVEKLTDTAVIEEIASKYHKSPQQIVIRWHIEEGNILIPKTSKLERLEENKEVFDFSLSREDHNKIAKLDSGIRVSQDPEDENWLKEIREK